MNEQTEWWQLPVGLSPFLIPIASAVVALLIRDLLDPRQWQRFVRKTLASATGGILVFAGMASGYLILLRYVGNEDSPIMVVAGFVIGLEVWPESHWPGFALREADVFKTYMAWWCM